MQSRPQSKGSLKYYPLDLAQKSSVEKFAECVKKEFKHVDILLNNSGLIRS
jgi:NADP-dependent 3-hydroxy acid dehydrogenase YdfG